MIHPASTSSPGAPLRRPLDALHHVRCGIRGIWGTTWILRCRRRRPRAPGHAHLRVDRGVGVVSLVRLSRKVVEVEPWLDSGLRRVARFGVVVFTAPPATLLPAIRYLLV